MDDVAFADSEDELELPQQSPTKKTSLSRKADKSISSQLKIEKMKGDRRTPKINKMGIVDNESDEDEDDELVEDEDDDVDENDDNEEEELESDSEVTQSKIESTKKGERTKQSREKTVLNAAFSGNDWQQQKGDSFEEEFSDQEEDDDVEEEEVEEGDVDEEEEDEDEAASDDEEDGEDVGDESFLGSGKVEAGKPLHVHYFQAVNG